MKSGVNDVTEVIDGRYRGLDIDDEIDESTDIGTVPEEDNITEVEILKRTIEDQATTIAKLQEAAGNDTKKQKRSDGMGDVMNMAMVADSFDKDKKIRELTDKIQLLEFKLRKQKNPNVESLFSDLQRSMDKRMTEMDNKMTEMKDSIQLSIDEKFQQHMETSKRTYASMAATGVEVEVQRVNTEGNKLRSVMAEAKNAEILVQNERQRREKNIIIHGVNENADFSNENKKEMDNTYVAALLLILGVDVNPKFLTRLGKVDANEKCRPLKVIMNSVEDKDQIMARLSNLRTAEQQYRNIIVKDDYTPEERDLVKTWHKKAEEKNKAENTKEWKVRGTPKNGLRLIKIKSNQTQLTQPPSTMDETD